MAGRCGVRTWAFERAIFADFLGVVGLINGLRLAEI
jgi:hypothetical protein